jgi:hypothetical protein
VDFIVLWSQGSADLSDLINLINAWAGGTACELLGDYPTCGEVTLGEVVNYIILWTGGEAELSDVIDLINAWSGG